MLLSNHAREETVSAMHIIRSFEFHWISLQSCKMGQGRTLSAYSRGVELVSVCWLHFRFSHFRRWSVSTWMFLTLYVSSYHSHSWQHFILSSFSYDNFQKYNLPFPEAVIDLNFYQRNPKPFLSLAKEIWPGLQHSLAFLCGSLVSKGIASPQLFAKHWWTRVSCHYSLPGSCRVPWRECVSFMIRSEMLFMKIVMTV